MSRPAPGTAAHHDGTGFHAAPAAMREAADGIDALVAELGTLTTAGRAGEGRGVPGMELGPDRLGHDALAAAFSSFCLRWDWGVRALVQDGTDMADGLRESVESYERADDGIGAAFAEVLGTQPADPAEEYLSAERWSRAGESMADTWTGVGQDIAATVQDRLRRAAAGENPYAPDLDALREIVE